MIKVSHLNKFYYTQKKPQQVLHDINFEVKPGEIFGFIGKSGAGKSTLLKCLNLLERLDTGSIVIDGVNLTELSLVDLMSARSQIGVIFQHFNLLSTQTVAENVALPLILTGKFKAAQIKTQVSAMLELVGLSNFAAKYPKELSGGQKQRVGVARSLINKPKVLLSDEATSALDPETTLEILDLLLEINQELGLSIVLITHQLEVVRKICDKIAVLHQGQIIEQGRAIDLLLHPKNQITRKLIIEEEAEKYLEEVHHFFPLDKKRHVLLLSFVGETTYQPILNIISKKAGVEFSILKGNLGLIKKTPFGQLLIEFTGEEENLSAAYRVIKDLNIHVEEVVGSANY